MRTFSLWQIWFTHIESINQRRLKFERLFFELALAKSFNPGNKVRLRKNNAPALCCRRMRFVTGKKRQLCASRRHNVSMSVGTVPLVCPFPWFEVCASESEGTEGTQLIQLCGTTEER